VDENNLPELREITNSREQRVTQPTKTEPSGDTLGQGNTSTSGDSQKKIPPNGMVEAGSVETLGYEENPDQSAKVPSEDRTKLERTQPWNIIPVPLDEKGADENITQAQLGEGTIHEKKAMIEESTSPRESKQLSSIRTDETYEMESGTGKLTSQVTEVRLKESGLEAEHSEPSVTVSIGRIEVRAIMPEKPPTKEQGPTLSLEEYLKRRREART
jgi:hypothetical protein